jgi:hypothetical protein
LDDDRPASEERRSLLVTAIDATKVDAFARRLFAGVTAVLTGLVVLAGCGGSSSSSRTPGATRTTSAISAARTAFPPHCDPAPCQLTHAELAAELDDLCVRGNGAVQQADVSFEQATKDSDYTKAAAAMESALREFPPYQSAILGLTPRPQDSAALTRYVDLTQRIHGLSERIVTAGHGRHTSEIIRLSQLVQEDLATRTRTAVDLGTKHCGR